MARPKKAVKVQDPNYVPGQVAGVPVDVPESVTEPLTIAELKLDVVTFRILGTEPIILNRLSEKAKRELLYPSKKKNQAEKESSLKHNPLEEYRASPYVTRSQDAPTRIIFPSGGFKKAIASAAVDIPGAFKSQIGRLTSVEGTHISLYGVPELLMAVVRNSDQKRTPDIRTRACIKNWACQINIRYVANLISVQDLANLVNAAGVLIGVGDFRSEKGAGSYGSFRIVGNDAALPVWEMIRQTGGLEAQDAALERPGFFDVDSEDLFVWYTEEVLRRKGAKAMAEESQPKGKAPNGRGKGRAPAKRTPDTLHANMGR